MKSSKDTIEQIDLYKLCIYVYIELERSIDSLRNANKEFLLFKCGVTKYMDNTRIKTIQSSTGTPEKGMLVWFWYGCPLSETEVHRLISHLKTYDDAGDEWFCFSPKSLEIEVAIEEFRDHLNVISGKGKVIERKFRFGRKRKKPVPKYLKMDVNSVDTPLPFEKGGLHTSLRSAEVKKKAGALKIRLRLKGRR